MSFQIFIPRATGANVANLRAVGLGDLFPEHDSRPACTEVMKGPDSGHGQLWGWPEETGVLSFDPARHDAWPCVPDPERQLPAGRFWWIFEKGRLPTEEQLRRKDPFGGFRVTLADGREWSVPNVVELPETYGFDESGNLTKTAKPIWRPFVDDCEWAMNQCLVAAGAEGQLDWRREFEVACRIVATNYRVNRELIVKLGLIDPENVMFVLTRAVDRERLLRLVDELKNSTAGPATPVGSGA